MVRGAASDGIGDGRDEQEDGKRVRRTLAPGRGGAGGSPRRRSGRSRPRRGRGWLQPSPRRQCGPRICSQGRRCARSSRISGSTAPRTPPPWGSARPRHPSPIGSCLLSARFANSVYSRPVPALFNSLVVVSWYDLRKKSEQLVIIAM